MEVENTFNTLRGLFIDLSSETEGWIWVDCTPLNQNQTSQQQQQQRIYVKQGYINVSPHVYVLDPRQLTPDLITCVIASSNVLYLGTKRGHVGYVTLHASGNHHIRWFNELLTSSSPSAHTTAITALHFSPQTKRLISADQSGQIVEWKLSDNDSVTWKILTSAESTQGENDSSAITCIVLSSNKTLNIHNTQKKKKKRKRQQKDANTEEVITRESEANTTLYIARAVDICTLSIADSNVETNSFVTPSNVSARIPHPLTRLSWKCVTPPITQLLLISPPLTTLEWLIVRSQHRLVHVLSVSSLQNIVEHSLVCPNVPLGIDVNRFRTQHEDEVHILGVTSLVVVVWIFVSSQNEPPKTIHPVAEIRVVSHNTPLSILDAKFIASDQILIVAGSSLQPELCTAIYVQENRIMSNLVVKVEKETEGRLLSKKDQKSTLEDAASSTRPASVVSGAEAVGQKPILQRPPLDLVDIPLELRIADLLAFEDSHSKNAEPTKEQEVSTQRLSESMTTIVSWLTQALNTRDRTAIGQILSQTRDRRTITDTVSRLPRHLLTVLLNEIAVRLSGGIAGHTARAANLIVWLRVVLTQHMAHVITTTDASLVQTLARIYQHIQARLAPFSDLLTLAGRLDLLTHQISAKKMQSVHISKTPLIVFNESNTESATISNDFEEDDLKESSGEDDEEDNAGGEDDNENEVDQDFSDNDETRMDLVVDAGSELNNEVEDEERDIVDSSDGNDGSREADDDVEGTEYDIEPNDNDSDDEDDDNLKTTSDNEDKNAMR